MDYVLTLNKREPLLLGGRLLTELRATRSRRVCPGRRPSDGLVCGIAPKSSGFTSVVILQQHKSNE